MRSKHLLLLALFLISTCATAQPQKDATGLEWLQLSMGERAEYILMSMAALTQSGVELGKSPSDYCDAVEEKLRLNPNLYSGGVTDILASVVYEGEPGSRTVLDKIRKAGVKTRWN